MRSLRIVCAVSVLLAGMAAAVSAAEPAGSVPKATLGAMGWGKVQPMSDSAGLAVRGKGSFAIVWGTGYGPIVRQHFARGGSFTISPGGGFSGGGAFAFAR
jgi:hypothetical protein